MSISAYLIEQIVTKEIKKWKLIFVSRKATILIPKTYFHSAILIIEFSELFEYYIFAIFTSLTGAYK